MNKLKIKSSFILCLFFILFFNLIDYPVASDLSLTGEEKEYIKNLGTIKAVSIDGGAPLHYRNSKGEITGIAVSVLEKISDTTGINFEYELYSTVENALKSEADLVFGITPHYAPSDMVLSNPYLISSTILFMNSSLDPNNLEDKRYASIKSGALPNGIKKENAIYFDSREDTINAVEKGKADYGYGNEYSLAFYTLQNNYKNIITIPKAIESREYTIGF